MIEEERIKVLNSLKKYQAENKSLNEKINKNEVERKALWALIEQDPNYIRYKELEKEYGVLDRALDRNNTMLKAITNGFGYFVDNCEHEAVVFDDEYRTYKYSNNSNERECKEIYEFYCLDCEHMFSVSSDELDDFKESHIVITPKEKYMARLVIQKYWELLQTMNIEDARNEIISQYDKEKSSSMKLKNRF